jgi:hypothetical protein
MDDERFDRLSRLLARGTTRRGVMTTLAALVGGRLLAPAATGATRRRHRQHRPVRPQDVVNTCATLCAVLPATLRPACVAQAASNPVACTCPSFCSRLYPRRPLRQLACLREAASDPTASLCLACAADPDRACLQADGHHVCCGAGETCDAGACVGGCQEDGAPCGADAQGATLRCCHGGCPQPTCLAAGTPCGTLSRQQCLAACCSASLVCQIRGGCACAARPLEPGVPLAPCASDRDCRNPSGAAQCVCGHCCVPAGSDKPAALPCTACCSGTCAGTGDACA